jgi:hypothetical protein
MNTRTIYIGVGACTCMRIDVQLYQITCDTAAPQLLCEACLITAGQQLPAVRPSNDIEAWQPGMTIPMPMSIRAPATAAVYDLGHQHTLETLFGANERFVGWLHIHPDQRECTAVRCQSFCAARTDADSTSYQIIDADPLTLSPSLRCPVCGAQGHVTNGQWEPC